MISLLTFCQDHPHTQIPVTAATNKDLQRRLLSLLPRTYWRLRNVVDAKLDPMGLSSGQWRPLLLLNDATEPMTQVQIARALSLESPTVARLLDRLVERGWVVRRNCPRDRRAHRVELTPAARAVCADIEKVLEQLRASVLVDFSRDDLVQAMALLDRLHDRLGVLEEAGIQSQASKKR